MSTTPQLCSFKLFLLTGYKLHKFFGHNSDQWHDLLAVKLEDMVRVCLLVLRLADIVGFYQFKQYSLERRIDPTIGTVRVFFNWDGLA